MASRDGYTALVHNILGDTEVELGVDFNSLKHGWKEYAHNLVYTGKLDEFFDYELGELEYRTLDFNTTIMDGDYQGTAQMNYSEVSVPFTRVVEHKHFNYSNQPKTVVTWEYPAEWHKGKTPYYPINDRKNNELALRYKEQARHMKNVIFGGRLADFQYYDMDAAIASALKKAETCLGVARTEPILS